MGFTHHTLSQQGIMSFWEPTQPLFWHLHMLSGKEGAAKKGREQTSYLCFLRKGRAQNLYRDLIA